MPQANEVMSHVFLQRGMLSCEALKGKSTARDGRERLAIQ